MKMILAVAVMIMVLGGCATGRMVGRMPQINNDNYATIHIARKAGWVGCGIRTNIQLNNIDFYWIACGERISFKVPSVEEIKISQTTSMSPDHIYLEPEKSKHYYFGNDCNGWICWFEEIPKSQYRSIADTCGEEKELKEGK